MTVPLNLVLEALAEAPPSDREVELVERKGLGHPDTICDALAEEVSRALCRHYLERFGFVLHHNVDKALLCGGRSTPRFGGGEVEEPIEIILAGRVTRSFRGVEIPAEELALEASRAWLRVHLHALDPDRHVRLTCRFREGSQDLVELFARKSAAAAPLANDTSIGVGFAPLSPLEQSVLAVEERLTRRETSQIAPEIGEDVKVMGVRRGRTVSLTVACAFVAPFVRDLGAYLEGKDRVAAMAREKAADQLGPGVDIVVNAADDPTTDSVYLTVTGTSAEAGDDGEVGRGNRAGGLITPGRPTTLEATAGKNPVTHVGKLYNVAARLVAEELVRALPDVMNAECVLVSRIGAPIDRPQIASVRLHLRDGRPVQEIASPTAEIVRDVLTRLPALGERIIAGEFRLY